MRRSNTKTAARLLGRIASISCAMWLACALVCTMHVPSALAYYALEPVEIGLASASIDVEKGSSSTVACSISPESERQLPGCGMLECPQGCGTLVNPRTGEKGGCQNSEGWCTCAGETYVTYNTKVTVSSSAPSVARASFSGGTIKVKGYSTGTATITVKATLSKHLDSREELVVHVVQKAEDTAGETGDSEGSDSAATPGSSGSSGSAASSKSTSGATGSGKSSSGKAKSKKSAAKKTGTKKSGSGSGTSKSSKAGATKGKSSKKTSSSNGGVSTSSASRGSTVTSAATSAAPVVVESSSKKKTDSEPSKASEAEADAGDAGAQEDEDEPGFEPDAAGQAAAAVSAVGEADGQGGPQGATAAGIVCVAAAIAAAAGAMRYRGWKLQHVPLSDKEAAVAAGRGPDDEGGSDEGAGE